MWLYYGVNDQSSNVYKLYEIWGSYRGVEDLYLLDGTLLQMINKTNISNNHSASLQDQAIPSFFWGGGRGLP